MKTYNAEEVTITIGGEEATPTKVYGNKFIAVDKLLLEKMEKDIKISEKDKETILEIDNKKYKKLWEECKNGKIYVVLKEED